MSGPSGAPGLQRSLGYWDLVLYGLAYIAPFAPLSTLGFVWEESNGLIVLAYLLGGVCMYFTAQSYATMTEALPTAGSVYGFARSSLGAYPGFIAGWMILLDYLLIPAFVYVLMAVALETLLPGVDRGVWIVSLVAVTTCVNWFGITVTSRANFISVALQVVILSGFVVLCVLALYGGKGNGGLTLRPVYDAAAFDAARIFSATSICIMSFLGFDAVSTLAEEVAGHDRRVVGRAIIMVLLLSAIFFVAVTWVFGNLLPGVTLRDPAAAIYELAAWATGPWTAAVLAWAYATIVGLSNALPMQVGVARVVFAMGRDRQLPAVMARIHPRHHTPYVGMLVTAVISLAVALYMKNKLDELASIVNFGALSGFTFLHISVLARFVLKQGSHAWIRHGLVPVCGIIVVLAVFSGMSALAVEVGCIWLAGGLVYGAVLRAGQRQEPPVPDSVAIAYSTLQRLRSLRHRFWYGVAKRVRWSRGTFHETPARSLPDLTLEQARRTTALRSRYQVQFELAMSGTTARNNYEYLDILDRAWSAAGLVRPRGGRLSDVGCASFWYAAALHAFFRPDSLVGVDVEGHRLFRDGRTRIDYAAGYLEAFPDARFLVADYSGLELPAEVITAWFPFVTPAAILAWRLPLSLLAPQRFFGSVCRNLQPGGIFVMVNHGPAEARVAEACCVAAGMHRVLGFGESGVFSQNRPCPALLSLWRRS